MERYPTDSKTCRRSFLLAGAGMFFGVAAALCGTEPEKERVVQVEDVGETGGSYVLFVPEGVGEKERLPVVYAFDSGGDGRSMLDHLRPAAEHYRWVVVGCNRLRNGMERVHPAGFAEQMTREIMDDVEKRVRVDPARRYLAGLSGGAMRAYGIAAHFERKFAGIIAFGGWLGHYEEDHPQPTGLAVAMINGRSDRGAERYRPRDAAILERNGSNVRAFLFDGGHTLPPEAETTLQAVRWLEEQATATAEE